LTHGNLIDTRTFNILFCLIFYGEFKKPPIKNFGLDLGKIFIIFLKKSIKNKTLKFYDFSNSGQKICRNP
jgi:hypothetical protein